MKEKEYEKVVLKLVDKFKESIPRQEQHLVKEFEKYLYLVIKNRKNSNSKFLKSDKASIENCLENETKKMIDYSLEQKKQILIRDYNFEKIGQISEKLYHMAIDILEGKEISVDFQYDEKEEELNQLLKLVEKYNKEEAEILVSETLLDLNFVCNPKTEILSLRLAEIKRNISYEEEER